MSPAAQNDDEIRAFELHYINELEHLLNIMKEKLKEVRYYHTLQHTDAYSKGASSKDVCECLHCRAVKKALYLLGLRKEAQESSDTVTRGTKALIEVCKRHGKAQDRTKDEAERKGLAYLGTKEAQE